MKFLPLVLLGALTVLRLVAAAELPVTPDEAYHWLCAQRLDWAFFDGPGGTAAVVRATTLVLGDGPLGLRFAFPLFAAIATYGAFLFGRALFGSTVGLWAAVTLNVAPVFSSAAVHAGPEMPALAGLLLSAWAFVRGLDYGIRWWTGAGFCLMLAEQFQTAAVLLAAGFVLVCLVPRRHRAEWRRPGIYFAFYLALTGLVPIWLWNQAHGWPALATGTLRTALTPQWPEIFRALADTVLRLSLPLSAVLALNLFTLARDGRRHFRPRIVVGLTAPFLAFGGYLLLHGSPAAAWYVFLVFAIALVAIVPAFLRTGVRRKIAAGLLLLAAIGTTISGNFGPAGKPAAIDWKSVALTLNALVKDNQPAGDSPLFVIAPDADATAALNYHLPPAADGSRLEVFLRESQDVSDQFGLWPRYDDFVSADKPADEFFKNEGKVRNPYLGRSALYLSEESLADLPQTIRSAFAAVTPRGELDLGGGRKLRVYLCADYQTMPL